MQRFSILAVTVATSLACGTLLAHADNDTPAQAAARAALEQQMTQMDNGQVPGSTNSMTPPAEPSTAPATPSAPPAEPSAPPATPSVAPATQPTLPPITTPTPQFSTNIPMNAESETPPAGNSATNEAAAAQVGSQTNAGAMNVPPAVLNTHETEQYPVNPPMAPLPSQVATEPAQPANPVPLPPATAQSNPNAQPAAPAVASTPTPGANPGQGLNNEPHNTTNSVQSFESITAPPLPISQQQQAELQSLLSQYMANQITPAQYREQREKIIAGQQ